MTPAFAPLPLAGPPSARKVESTAVAVAPIPVTEIELVDDSQRDSSSRDEVDSVRAVSAASAPSASLQPSPQPSPHHADQADDSSSSIESTWRVVEAVAARVVEAGAGVVVSALSPPASPLRPPRASNPLPADFVPAAPSSLGRDAAAADSLPGSPSHPLELEGGAAVADDDAHDADDADDADEPVSAVVRASSAPILPRERWSTPEEPPLVRGPKYFEDGKKILAEGGPLCTLFAIQLFELTDEHLAGAGARLLETGALVPPPDAKFVLTIHFMNPRPSRNAPHNVVLMHAYSRVAPEEAAGPTGHLLRELWSGDAVNAITRCKILAALRSGPALVRATMSWIGLDETRPLLMCRQVHASINRATLAHRHTTAMSPTALSSSSAAAAAAAAAPSTFQHVEIALDLAASPLCNQMYKYAWPSLPSVMVNLTVLLEARDEAHLPEHHLVGVAVQGIEHSEVVPQPPEWPSGPHEVPGEMVGSYTSGRAATDVGSWQSTRQIITDAKKRK